MKLGQYASLHNNPNGQYVLMPICGLSAIYLNAHKRQSIRSKRGCETDYSKVLETAAVEDHDVK